MIMTSSFYDVIPFFGVQNDCNNNSRLRPTPFKSATDNDSGKMCLHTRSFGETKSAGHLILAINMIIIITYCLTICWCYLCPTWNYN